MKRPDQSPRIAFPTGLRAPGRALWRRVVEDFELTAVETVSLELACRALDELTAIRRELSKTPLTHVGYRGHPSATPLLEEIRRHTLVVSKLLAGVGIDDEDTTAAVAAAGRLLRASHRAPDRG